MFSGALSIYAQDYRLSRGIADLHSNISDGKYPPGKIAELAQEKDLEVLIFGDSALRKWNWGLWPFRGLVKKTFQEKSVFSFGVQKYLELFSSLKKDFKDLVIIPALEVSPFYYWQGNPLGGDFSLNDYYRQFLVIGLDSDGYQNLPILGGRSKFNQYQLRPGIRPYQELIDYVNKRKGLVFWAHPEMESSQRYKGIDVYSPKHLEDLFLSKDYTGFSLTFTDRLEALEIGEVWDKLLLEYLWGRRKKPAWIIGTLHYDGILRQIGGVETMFWLKKRGEEDVLGALREGRMYVRFNRGKNPAVLTEFSLKKETDSLQIAIKGKKDSLSPITIEVIRDGKFFKIFTEQAQEWSVVFDDYLSAGQSAYYRLKVTDPETIILTNPLFVGIKNNPLPERDFDIK